MTRERLVKGLLDQIDESATLDFKREINLSSQEKKKEFAKDVSAFANTNGGHIVFGKEDPREGGHVVGIERETFNHDQMQQIISRRCYPPVEFQPELIQLESKWFGLLTIQKSTLKPHEITDTREVWIRRGATTDKATAREIMQMWKEKERKYQLEKYELPENLKKYDLVNTIYSPIYSELASYYNQKRIKKWKTATYDKIRREKLILLSEDEDLYFDLDVFYERVRRWNMAVDQAPFRLANIINSLARDFFSVQLPPSTNYSAIKLDVKAESRHEFPYITEAILNREDPLDFWKDNHPFDRILEANILLEYMHTTIVKTMVIQRARFREFMEKLTRKVEKDELIRYIWKEFEELQGYIETGLLEQLRSRL